MKTLKEFNLIQIILIFLICLSLVMGCNENTSTEPEPTVADNSDLLVNSLSIALVKQGTQTISVEAYDKDGKPENFTVTSGDGGIATVLKADNTFTVRGVNYGSTEITITSNTGEIKQIPVIVYNPQVMETDELLITFSQTFQYRWDDQGSGGNYNGSYYHPVTSNGFFPLGSLGFFGYSNPNGIWGVMVVKAKAGSDALAHPTDYILVYNDAGSGANDNGSFWTPVPPPGYKAMGTVAQMGWGKPSLTDVVCVREDLTMSGEAGEFIWNDRGTGANNNFGSFKIAQPVIGPHENAYLSTGTFVGWNYYEKPSTHPVMNVLNVKLPMLAETPYQQYAPKLTGYDPPPDETIPILAREMLVPCTIVSDPLYAGNEMWRVTNSPLYRLERKVFYKLLYHNHNQTSIQQQNSYTRRFGVSTTESQEFWNETSISVTVEAGISIKIFEAKVSATVSTSFGYSAMTSVTELVEEEYQSGIDVLPGKAVAIWQRYNRFVLKRHNGTTLEPVKAWEFGINSFITDEYPDE